MHGHDTSWLMGTKNRYLWAKKWPKLWRLEYSTLIKQTKSSKPYMSRLLQTIWTICHHLHACIGYWWTDGDEDEEEDEEDEDDDGRDERSCEWLEEQAKASRLVRSVSSSLQKECQPLMRYPVMLNMLELSQMYLWLYYTHDVIFRPPWIEAFKDQKGTMCQAKVTWLGKSFLFTQNVQFQRKLFRVVGWFIR